MVISHDLCPQRVVTFIDYFFKMLEEELTKYDFDDLVRCSAIKQNPELSSSPLEKQSPVFGSTNLTFSILIFIDN